jgi:hypothetical protein
MTYPRNLCVSKTERATYHCVTRCVRRAYLCGQDPWTGRSYEHRKDWIEERIHALAKVFAVAIHSYTVMSNHVHIVIEVDPLAPSLWSDERVATRWLLVFGRAKKPGTPDPVKRAAILADPDRLRVLRRRLGDLSWFMRCLNEFIARRANREDECTGRFWEGRFKCQRLLDETARLSCMVYVDLNPWRAGTSRRSIVGTHTSLAARLGRSRGSPRTLEPVAASISATIDSISLRGYVALTRAAASTRTNRTGASLKTHHRVHGINYNDFWATQAAEIELRRGLHSAARLRLTEIDPGFKAV